MIGEVKAGHIAKILAVSLTRNLLSTFIRYLHLSISSSCMHIILHLLSKHIGIQ